MLFYSNHLKSGGYGMPSLLSFRHLSTLTLITTVGIVGSVLVDLNNISFDDPTTASEKISKLSHSLMWVLGAAAANVGLNITVEAIHYHYPNGLFASTDDAANPTTPLLGDARIERPSV